MLHSTHCTQTVLRHEGSTPHHQAANFYIWPWKRAGKVPHSEAMINQIRRRWPFQTASPGSSRKRGWLSKRFHLRASGLHFAHRRHRSECTINWNSQHIEAYYLGFRDLPVYLPLTVGRGRTSCPALVLLGEKPLQKMILIIIILWKSSLFHYSKPSLPLLRRISKFYANGFLRVIPPSCRHRLLQRGNSCGHVAHQVDGGGARPARTDPIFETWTIS